MAFLMHFYMGYITVYNSKSVSVSAGYSKKPNPSMEQRVFQANRWRLNPNFTVRVYRCLENSSTLSAPRGQM